MHFFLICMLYLTCSVSFYVGAGSILGGMISIPIGMRSIPAGAMCIPRARSVTRYSREIPVRDFLYTQ